MPVNYSSTIPQFEEEDLLPAAITDTGCERDLNEDRYAVIESPSGVAWIVCDGMGGVSGGELAAQLAIEAIKRSFEGSPRRATEASLKSAILEANRIIVLRRQNPAFSSMGTTLVCALFMGSEVAIGHVGDSRAYLVRDFSIQQLTHDHTLVQEMVDRGQLEPEEALTHPQAHVLTKCLGSEPGLEVQTKKYWVWETGEGEANDYLLLCSDGLYSHVSDAEIATIVSKMSPQKACVELIEIAKSRGGFDNITVTIIPLAGQLKKEPPVGFDALRNLAPRTKAELGSANQGGRRWTGVIVTSLILCVISSFLVMATFFLMM